MKCDSGRVRSKIGTRGVGVVVRCRHLYTKPCTNLLGNAAVDSGGNVGNNENGVGEEDENV